MPPQEKNLVLSGELILNGQRYHLVPARPATEPASDVRLLTSRELQIASCVRAGWGNKQNATKLNISAWTVAAHLRRSPSRSATFACGRHTRRTRPDR
ncbi:LuxR C-terminal-related transcriptional regulator [Corallococcus sp. EGB]|uniref:LuxR C-terminal-related transcriptional regulator n=1 Tax=Corallococcus sp. EGB TaxID=1521117 RepID=UPI001CBDABD9